MEEIKKINQKNKKYHKVENITFESYFIYLLVDGKPYEIDLRNQSPKLAKSNLKIKNNYVISPSGYGIHWEDIDEDLSVDGLIKSSEKTIVYKNVKSGKLILKDKNKRKQSGGKS